MRFRKLRIAFSVLCAATCVLLIVLWVRSYWWIDQIVGTFGTTVDRVTGEAGDKYGIGFGALYGCIGGEFLYRPDSTSTLPPRTFRITTRSTGNRTIQLFVSPPWDSNGGSCPVALPSISPSGSQH